MKTQRKATYQDMVDNNNKIPCEPLKKHDSRDQTKLGGKKWWKQENCQLMVTMDHMWDQGKYQGSKNINCKRLNAANQKRL